MRIADFLTIVLGISLTSVYVYSKPVYDHRTTLLLPDDIIRVKKRNEESTTGYLEQCGSVTFPMAQRGVVNVLAFLDSSWPYSHRQAIMLKMLNDRLRRSGLPDALFFVVNVDPDSAYATDEAEDDVEREAWLGVSPEEIQRFSDIDKTVNSLELSMNPHIKLIQDDENLRIWKNLRGSRDQVLVIDRCGKLTYQVIVPWSILHFPYVKAAILSTYNDEPCGPCNAINNATEVHYNSQAEKSTMLDSAVTKSSITEEYFQNDRENMMISEISVTTESDILGEENATVVNHNPESFVVSATSKYGDEGRYDINEATSIAGFLEFDTTVETATASNLILKKDNSSAEFELEEPEEFKTWTISTVGSNNGTSFLDESEKGISTVTSGFTEETAIPETTTSGQTETPEEVLIDEDFGRNNEAIDYLTTSLRPFDIDATSGSVENYYTTSTNVETTTEESFNSDGDEDDNVTDSSLLTSGVPVDDLSTSFDSTTDDMETTTEQMLVSSLSSQNPSRFGEDSENNKYSQLLKIRLEGSEETDKVAEQFAIPLRIIMHAPHFHADAESTKMHEYLILRTGSSEHHSHLSSRDATRLYSGPQDFQGNSNYKLSSEEIEAKPWSMTNVIYNKDESPGLYGEVADFWRGLNSPEIYDEVEDTEQPEEEQIAEETGRDAELWQNRSEVNNEDQSSKIGSEAIETATLSTDELVTAQEATEMLQADVVHETSTENHPTNIEELNPEEEETRNKLIAHYSKLLPWIYYVLDK